ncbi:MAG: hypothetical protein ABEI53_02645 [Candidatus Magasanikbacteria bacterium]
MKQFSLGRGLDFDLNEKLFELFEKLKKEGQIKGFEPVLIEEDKISYRTKIRNKEPKYITFEFVSKEKKEEEPFVEPVLIKKGITPERIAEIVWGKLKAYKKGFGNEDRVEEVLHALKEKGEIEDFSRTLDFGPKDIQGIDFLVIVNSKECPLQVKSSEQGQEFYMTHTPENFEDLDYKRIPSIKVPEKMSEKKLQEKVKNTVKNYLKGRLINI